MVNNSKVIPKSAILLNSSLSTMFWVLSRNPAAKNPTIGGSIRLAEPVRGNERFDTEPAGVLQDLPDRRRGGLPVVIVAAGQDQHPDRCVRLAFRFWIKPFAWHSLF